MAQVRDRNRVAAAEAERRKDLRRVALEKRRTKVWGCTRCRSPLLTI